MESITPQNDRKYFVMGKNRIIIKEHFQKGGKPLDIILEKVIYDAEKMAENRINMP